MFIVAQKIVELWVYNDIMNLDYVLGFLILLWGVLSLVSPGTVLRFRIWFAKRFFGADFTPTQKTYRTQRTLGVLFIALGFLILL